MWPFTVVRVIAVGPLGNGSNSRTAVNSFGQNIRKLRIC